MFERNSTKKSRRNITKFARKVVRAIRVTCRTSSNVKRSKVKVTRPINAVTENQPYLLNGKAYTNFKLGIRMEYDHRHARCPQRSSHTRTQWNMETCVIDMRNDLQAESGCSSHHLQGAGAYSGGRATGRTACMELWIYARAAVCRPKY